jgi:ribose 5-phosphate isomerase B
MRFYLGSDHAGYELKTIVKDYLIKKEYEVDDLGTYSEQSVDYPDFAKKVANVITTDEDSVGILVCGTGIGMSIAANRFKGVRAALVRDSESAKMARAHNDANILVLAGRLTESEDALRYLDIFINTPFDGGRHIRRVEKFDE